MTQTSARQPAAGTAQRWVYLFAEAPSADRDLLGGKGAGVAAMTQAGLPVPPGFTITTEACRAYYRDGERFPDGMWEQALAALRALEQETGKKLGDPTNPLLVSVRSGAKFSMPGMMDTVLNLGLNDDSAAGLARLTNNERFAQDAYRRFIQMFGRIVLGISAEPLLTARGEEGMLEASRDAGLLVVGLSTRWHQEGLGPARLKLARDATPPTLLVRRGLRPGGLAPPAALTRFTWSIRT